MHTDAVFLLEVKPADRVATEAPDGWAFALQRPSNDSRGLVILVPADHVHLAHIESFTVPGTTRDLAVVRLGAWTAMQSHLARPGSERGFAEQVAISQKIAEWTGTQRGTGVVVLGDFNAAPWSAAVAPLRDAGLHPGRGAIAGTWPASMPPGLRVPIDHAFSNRRCNVTVGPDLGGDHRPIVVQLTE